MVSKVWNYETGRAELPRNFDVRRNAGKSEIRARSAFLKRKGLRGVNEKLRDLKIRGAIARKSERRGVASVQRMAIPRAYSVTKARLSRHVSIILCQIVCRCRGTSCSFLDPLALAPRYLCVTVSIEILCRSPVVHLLPRLPPSTRIFFSSFFFESYVPFSRI